jgi:excisionase family DNA binding protein
MTESTVVPAAETIRHTTSDSARLVDIATVAGYLGVNVRHIRRLVAERRIPYVKWGHLLRFDMDEIREWVNAKRVSSSR